MSIKRSAVIQSECENGYKKLKKKGKISNQGIYQNVQSLHYATVKKVNAGALK
jgi:hypothetical protein